MTKKDYPIFRNNPGLIILDSGATGVKPEQVIRKEMEFNECFYGPVGRGNCKLSLDATKLYEEARNDIANHFGASQDELILNSGATEGLNQIAYGMKSILKAGDEVLLCILEHNSNVLPWMRLSEELGIRLLFVQGKGVKIDVGDIISKVSNRTKVISLAHVSNVSGQILDIESIALECRNRGIYFFVDGSQSVAHLKTDLAKIKPSGFVFSGHKIGGPTGVGGLFLDKKLIDVFRPMNLGGGIVNGVDQNGYTLIKGNRKFEAGTPKTSQVIGLAESLKLLNYEEINIHEQALIRKFIERSRIVPGLKIIGGEEFERAGLISFYFDKIHPHDVACSLAEKNICIRAGYHCSDIIHRSLGIPGSTRVSFGPYNEENEIDLLMETLVEIVKIFN